MKYLLMSLAPVMLAAIPYDVKFEGLDQLSLLNAIKDASNLVNLQARPPASINGIRYRISGDLPNMLKVLHAYGYYDANITSDIQLIPEEKVQVTLFIQSGPQYKIGAYEVFHKDCLQQVNLPCCDPFSAESLGLSPGSPALSVSIVNAELNLLTDLSRCGYPLASVEKRKIIVDMQTKTVEAASCIDEGPLSKFGPLTIFGLKSVKPRFILEKISWQEGEIYSSLEVEKTQKKLLDSDLFSSVLISHEEGLDAEGELPMKMRLSEAKHRQITLGVFYATVDGPGGTFTWTNRNVRGIGQVATLYGEFSKRYLTGSLSYKVPDFLNADQTLRALAQIEREKIRAFLAFTYRFASYLDWKIDYRKNVSAGIEVQHINVADSANNGTYLLIDIPLFARYNAADDLLNPTKGYSLVYQPHLFQSLEKGSQHFIKQRLTGAFYIPIWKKWVIFAGRFQFGSIAGAPQRNIPLPILFLGGSEDDLRGYRYLTVSPLNQDNKPFGGRSAIFLTAEMRLRLGETIGIVPFADFGTVTFKELPTVDAKWFKSWGLGLRYFTFFGPLRFDIGFPIDRRKIDPAFRIYASIGQTF